VLLNSSQKPATLSPISPSMETSVAFIMGQIPLLSAAESLFEDIAQQKPSSVILSHFSTTQNVTLQHDYVYSAAPCQFVGLHAVRSYFDLLSLHWERDNMHHTCDVRADKQQVVVKASVQWTWRVSRKSWREDFTCTLDFDEMLKVKGFLVSSNPPEECCVMRAVDGTTA
jgi:hypothetical protein